MCERQEVRWRNSVRTHTVELVALFIRYCQDWAEFGQSELPLFSLATLARLFGRTIGELVMREEPVEPFSVQFRSTLSPAAYEEEGLDPYVFEFQRLCEDYIHLEQLSAGTR